MQSSTPELKLIDYLSKIGDKSGYLAFKSSKNPTNRPDLYIGIVNGRVVWSYRTPFGIQELIEIIRRYSIQTHNPSISSTLDKILNDTSKKFKPLDKIYQLIQAHIIDETHLTRVLRTQVLRDLDTYLYQAGSETFIADLDLSAHLPIRGFGIKTLLDASMRRINYWSSIKDRINIEDVLILKQPFISPRLLPLGQLDLIVDLIRSKTSIKDIAVKVARDDLDICEFFLGMIKANVVEVPKKVTNNSALGRIPPILAIDSSESVLSRVYSLIDKMGYPMIRCNDIDVAVEVLGKSKPVLVLIETKMLAFGEASLRQVIKDTPGLADVPIAVMSSEGQRLSKMTAKNYFQVNKPEDSGDLSGMKFIEQVSGILEKTKP
jgi:hypothetical protein